MDKDIIEKILGFDIRAQTLNGENKKQIKKIILTEKAYEFKESLEKCIQKMEAILVKDLEPREIEDLIRIMNKIKNNLK